MPPLLANLVHYPKRRKPAGGNPMTRISMTRINALRNNFRNNARTTTETHSFISWGKHASALIFAAVLIVCSVTVGCSSDNDKPKSVSSNTQIPVPAAPAQLTPAPAMQAAAKPPAKRVVSKKPATVNYADKTYGVTFEYPRRYAIETGDAATELLASNPLAMNFVAPGGVALAAVELPETSFTNTDFSSAFFNVSVHKSLTAEQCTEFAVPQPKPVMQSESVPTASTEVAKDSTSKSDASSAQAQPTPNADQKTADHKITDQKTDAKPADSSTSPEQLSVAKASNGNSKLMLGDLELRATEAVSGEGARQSDSKYFHIFQNGSCYEFALNVTTNASEDGLVKHVDRDKVFTRLEQILATVKIDAPKTEESKIDESKVDGVKVAAVKTDTATTDTAKTDAVKAIAAPEAKAEAPSQTPAETPAQ
jgi:hypothetical protein